MSFLFPDLHLSRGSHSAASIVVQSQPRYFKISQSLSTVAGVYPANEMEDGAHLGTQISDPPKCDETARRTTQNDELPTWPETAR
ncbi:hypothetical protein DACRYDRAFT_21760 [Dacryopinax primogenitus]|uniref:Uncharacterized protein n=1 Tax=Dacryopinax primogenitus (strain DJM 731) TaxID=1858805 RepID=M5FXP9_DACPD|nr:uncharacterized protein DACRYDRAFT_21760 [Dacryopinax primogenitus]EJU02806.1 hypothetical protein DACRYDRAFT_21760 [Dacryopinax primogenitus]